MKNDGREAVNNKKSTRRKSKITVIDDILEKNFQNVGINWVPAIALISTPLLALILVPWYAFTYGFTTATYIVFALFLAWSGLGITAGYHRLWAHKTYKAKLPVRFMLLVGATLAVQSSAFDWCSGHRIHHREVDDVYEDPYSSKRGFWFSHIGWMLKKFPSGQYDYKNINDLKKDRMLEVQHKQYHWCVLATNVLMPLAIGFCIGDMWGTLLLAGLFRLVLSHHFTFFINSLAHIWGSQPYTDENTARDNAFLAIFTWGEGYHNYHHIFENDYRNGIKWWQYDPTKWLIFSLSKVGLTYDLKIIPELKVEQAKMDMQFRLAQPLIEAKTLNNELVSCKKRITLEYDIFLTTLQEWKETKQSALQTKIAEKKAHALLEKEIFEQKMNEKFEQKIDDFEQAKEKLHLALAHTLQEVDRKLQQDKATIEKRMQNQRKKVEQMVTEMMSATQRVSNN